MKFLLSLLFISSFCLATDLPQDIRFDPGSLVVLQQYIESKPDADPSFPVFVNMSCVPKMKLGKVAGYKCQAADVKYATKLKGK